MDTKIVSQLDTAGYFLAPTVADESPLEPGVWLIPGGAIDQAPPLAINPGKRYRPENGGWVEEDIPPPSVDPDTPVDENGIPQEVTRFQALAALHLSEKLEQVEAIMAQPETSVLTKLAWQNALVFKRQSPMVLAIGEVLGLSAEDLDQLFITAASIE